MNSLLPVLVCTLIVITFGAFLLAVAHLLGAKVKGEESKAKKLPYECGLEGEETSSSRVPVQFYLTAILFVLFDIEIIFIYPWALSFNDFLSEKEGMGALIGLLVFLLIFLYGLFWEISSKALNWK